MTMLRWIVRVLLSAFILALAACGKSPDALLIEAEALKEKGDRSAAILQVKSLLQEHPDHVPSRLFLGLLYKDAADYASAEKELLRALDGQADPAQALPALAKALLMQGQAKKVLAEISPDKVSDGAAKAKVLALHGSAYLALRQKEQAQQAFQQALAVKPGATEALVGIARILAGERKLEEALAEVGKAVQGDPKDADALLLQGDLLHATGKREAAEQSYKKLIAAHPSHVGGLLALVSTTIADNRLDEANTYVATVRKASPGHPMASYFQALIAFRKNDFKAARDAIGAVLKVAPNHLPSVLLGGAVEFALGSQELAQARLKFVLERVPANLYARRVLAASYTKAGQTQKALETLEPALKGGVKDPAILALAGEVHMQMNDFERARSYFEQASALAPKNARMRTGLGLSRLASGDVDAATADLESAAQLDATRNHADVLLVSTYLQRKQFDQALKAAESLVTKQPQSPVGYNLVAAAYLGKKQEELARKALHKALEVQPSFVPAAVNLAQLDLRAGDKRGARSRLESIIEKDKANVQAYIALVNLSSHLDASVDDIRGWLESARRESPETMQPLVMLTRFHFLNKESKKALELVEKALVGAPNNPELLELAGQVQLASGEKNKALASFVKLVALQPSAVSYLRLATSQIANEDYSSATGSLRKAIELRPQFPDAQVLLAETYSRLGKTVEARRIAARLREETPKSPLGWIVEGDALFAAKSFKEATQAYQYAYSLGRSGPLVVKWYAALERDGKGLEGEAKLSEWLKAQPLDHRVRMRLAEAQLAGGRHREAIESYEILLRSNPGNVVVLNNLAWSYFQIKDARAMKTAEDALKLSPENPAVLDTLGVIAVESGNAARGVELLKKASSLAPKSPDIRFHYAKALISASAKSEARAELERLLVEHASYANSAEVVKLLTRLRQ